MKFSAKNRSLLLVFMVGVFIGAEIILLIIQFHPDGKFFTSNDGTIYRMIKIGEERDVYGK